MPLIFSSVLPGHRIALSLALRRLTPSPRMSGDPWETSSLLSLSTSRFAFIHRAAPSGFPSHWSTENASAEFSQEWTSFRIVEPGSICSHCTVPTSPAVSLAYAPPCPSSTCSSLRTASRHPSSLHSAAPSTKRPEHYFTKVICLRNTLIKTLWLLNALMQIYYYYYSLQNPEYDKFLLI